MTALEACHRAYHAWVRTQPQLILDLWDDYGLEQADGHGEATVGLLEPALPPSQTSPRGGLDSCGTEPRHAHGADGKQPRVSGHHFPFLGSVSVGAALSTTTETGANHFPVTRTRLQEGL